MYNDAVHGKTISFKNYHSHHRQKYAQFFGWQYDSQKRFV